MKRISDIKGLLPNMATAAQKAYDHWEQDEEGMDPELGAGGICQDIAEEISGVLASHGIEASTVSQTIEDQHVYTIAQVAEGVVRVDIHPSVYETGSGYHWKKRLNVTIHPTDIDVEIVDKNPTKYEEYTKESSMKRKCESSTYSDNTLKSNQLQWGLYINDYANPFRFDKQAESRQSQKDRSYSTTYPDNTLKYTKLQDGLYKRAVTYIKVDKFWMKPDPLLVTAKKFSFGYTEQKGKERKYTVEVKDDDLESFHAFVFKILETRRKSILPWPSIGKLKEKVNIASPDAGAIQMELPLRVARAYMERRIAETLPELIFTVGMPASGKTTWIKSQKGFEVVSLDEIRRQFGNITDQSKDAEVVRIGKSRLKSLLEQGKNVIFDATNIKSQYRKDILEGLPPCKKKAKVFHVDLEEAKRRIKLDIQNKVDRSNVPDEAIDRLYVHYRKTMDDNELQSEGFEVI